MDKVYNHKETEEKHYSTWENKGYFKPQNRFGEKAKYSIILPPPNANAPLHFGHAMYVIEDILIRFHRMRGYKTLWLPGADHAGFETQFVYEKKLQEVGKSRFDFDRETLYKNIWDYVQENRKGMENQLRRLGFSLDWEKRKFTLDEDVINIVYKTFKNLYDDGFLYRAKRLVNYCTYDGTSFSDLEVVYEERQNPLYYIKYGPLVLATTRPETKFGDTAVAVHPDDKRYKQYIGQEIEIETVLGRSKIKVIADKMVDPAFGTGVVKITPAHDFDDYEVSLRHNLPMIQVIDLDGRMNEKAGSFKGLYVKQARKAVVEKMQEKGLIDHIDENYTHRIGLCYKCKNPIEPLPLEQWFIKMDELKKIGQRAASEINISPRNFEQPLNRWIDNVKDWNISRQLVWGIRIPAFKCEKCGQWEVTEGDVRDKCGKCSGKMIQDPDTFDTWFSSGQWPYATLKTTNSMDFYPTTVMETGRDILFFWVARMIMLGVYIQEKNGEKDIKKQIPFQNVVLHGLVNDPLGKKMSKSKGNVINPLELVDQYGADAVRFALVYGTALGNDQSLSYPKLEAMRKFTNKLWNMARFIEIAESDTKAGWKVMSYGELLNLQKNNIKTLDWEYKDSMILNCVKIVSGVTNFLGSYQFNLASEWIYDYAWHQLADKDIENVKKSMDEESWMILKSIYLILLKLLHPFMPFVTEDIYQRLYDKEGSLMVSQWPK